MEQSTNQRYETWLNDPVIDAVTKAELREIEGNGKEIEDRFYRDLEFGTGGLRGVMGAGTNRMNTYTVGKATQGLASWVLEKSDKPAVVIAHDSRNNSPEFALEAALVLAANGVTAYLFKGLRPTPQLSFAVRELGATSGIVVTASHNPPEYNGYKAYGPDGCQLVPEDAEQVIGAIQRVSGFDQVRRISREEAEAKGLLRWLGDEEDSRYVDTVVSVQRPPSPTSESPAKRTVAPWPNMVPESARHIENEQTNGTRRVFNGRFRKFVRGNFERGTKECITLV